MRCCVAVLGAGEAMLSTLILTLGFSPDEEHRRLSSVAVAMSVVRRFVKLWKTRRSSDGWLVRV